MRYIGRSTSTDPMAPPVELSDLLREHRGELLRRWTELWEYVQSQRPESNFPDPPYEALLDLMPFDPSRSQSLPAPVSDWFERSPVFCSGAALCQLHVTVAALLIRKNIPERVELLRRLESSIETLMLATGTRRWMDNLYRESGAGSALHSERLAVIGHFAAGIAHEIGNPLASISAIVQLLERRTGDAFTIDQLAHVHEGVNRIARIVRELTDFARPARTLEVPTDVNEVLLSAVTLARYDRRTREITIETDLDPVLPSIPIVPDQLLQVLINLLINAIDALDGKGAITTSTRATGNAIRIAVRDNGHGIPAAILPRIFDPFFTTKPVGKGTGLGLSVSHGIISSFGGRIEVETAPGEGATFIVVLPI